jgi:predicted membrane chloride channel (bestrophin family)
MDPLMGEEANTIRNNNKGNYQATTRTSMSSASASPPTHARHQSIQLSLDELAQPSPPASPSASQNVRNAAKTTAYKRDVTYNGDNHLEVLFQMHGSVWPHVFPWCIATIVFTYAIILLRNHKIVDLTIDNNNGHSFMSILVSFLVVTRATITYNRFYEARQFLADLFRSSRETIQYACLLTTLDRGTKAQQWRQDVAYRTIVSLRVAIAAVEFRSHGVSAWETLPDEDHEYTPLLLPQQVRQQPTSISTTALQTLPANTPTARDKDGVDDSKQPIGQSACATTDQESIQQYKPVTDHSQFLEAMRHGSRTVMDENLRAPIVWCYNLREKILEPRKGGILVTHPPHINEELRLLAITSDWLTAFHGLKMLLTTPFPFPFVQMTRTFLFVWVFTLPMVLIADNDQTLEVLVLMFFITYGFLGLEYVNMELDDPYGTDPNDFPGKRWAELVYEDIYITLYKTDGFDSAMALRNRITERIARGTALDNFNEDMHNSKANFFGTHSFKHSSQKTQASSDLSSLPPNQDNSNRNFGNVV